MLSLHVEFLFTNVPIKGALSCFYLRLPEFHCSDIKVKDFINLKSALVIIFLILIIIFSKDITP